MSSPNPSAVQPEQQISKTAPSSAFGVAPHSRSSVAQMGRTRPHAIAQCPARRWNHQQSRGRPPRLRQAAGTGMNKSYRPAEAIVAAAARSAARMPCRHNAMPFAIPPSLALRTGWRRASAPLFGSAPCTSPCCAGSANQRGAAAPRRRSAEGCDNPAGRPRPVYPPLSVALGECAVLIGALTVEAAAKHLNSRDIDGIVLGDASATSSRFSPSSPC